MGCFPEHDLDDRQTGEARFVMNQAGDVFGRRITVHLEDPLTALPEHRQERVFTTEQHVMIEVFVDPRLNLALDFAEVDENATLIEGWAADRDDRAAIMTVQVAALAVVIEQTMSITEVNLADDAKTGLGMARQGDDPLSKTTGPVPRCTRSATTCKGAAIS